MKNFDTPLDEMLYILSKECEQSVPENLTENDKRWLINSLMTIRSPGYLDERFLVLQNEMLKKECQSRVMDCSNIKFKKHFALTRKDITDLRIDAICCETMDYIGCMTPNLKCMDNKILLKGGLEIREELNKINRENNYICPAGSAFKLNSYNLPCSYIVKTVYPHMEELITQDVAKFKCGITSALNILKENNIRRFAINLSIDKFYGISNEMYINIAIHTISSFMRDNKYKFNCVLVVDNEQDEQIVKNKLKLKVVY